MIRAGIYNTDIEQGSTFERTIRLKDKLGNVVYLTGYDKIRMQIRHPVDSRLLWDSSELANDSEDLIEIVDNHLVHIKLGATTTAAFHFIEAKYDVEVYNDSEPDDVGKPLRGKFILITESTK